MSLDEQLIKAAEKGDIEGVRTLLEKGANVNANIDDSTSLHLAALMKSYNIVELLLNRGANIHAEDENGKTPLHLAPLGESYSIVELLLNKGANIHAKDENNETPLHFAVERGSFSIVELLLNRGASVHAKGRRSTTPLHNAIYYYNENPRIIGLLLEYGADIYAKDTAGRSPEELCTLYHNIAERFFPLLLFGSYTNKDFEYINKDFEYINAYSDSVKDGIAAKKNCLTAFEEIKAMPRLGKLIEANKSRDKKESVKTIASYINNKAEGQELIKEFKTIKEKYGSDKQLSFVPEQVLDFIEHFTLKFSTDNNKTIELLLKSKDDIKITKAVLVDSKVTGETKDEYVRLPDEIIQKILSYPNKADEFLNELKNVCKKPNTALAASQSEAVPSQSRRCIS